MNEFWGNETYNVDSFVSLLLQIKLVNRCFR